MEDGLDMRILHVIRTVNYTGGGPIEGLTRISEVVINRGHTVDVVCLDNPNDEWVSSFPRKVYALNGHKGNYGYSPELIPWLEKNVDNYDVVLVNGLWQYHGRAIWSVLHKKEIPYAVFTHGMLDPWFKKTYPFKHLKKWIYWLLAEYRVLRDASAVFFTSEEERIQARKSFWLYRVREKVIGYGTSIPKSNSIELIEKFYEAYPKLRQKKILLFLGRIHEKKGCDLLIEAFSQVFGSNPEYHLVMAGPDQTGWQVTLNKRAIELGLQDQISWLGMIKGDMKLAAYYAADAFVLPSHQENFGIAVAEALACGTPVLISNKVNIWREIEEDRAGLVNDDTLQGCISLLSQWSELSQMDKNSMRVAAKNTFLNHFEISKATDDLLAFCQSLIESKKKS